MSIKDKKIEHIRIAKSLEFVKNGFEEYEITYFSLPKYTLKDIDYRTSLVGKEISCPFFINAITLGTDFSDAVNRDLAEVAHNNGILFFPGSITPYLKLEKLPLEYPYKSINIGLDKSPDKILEVVKHYSHINYLQIHLNPLQELVTQEDCDLFSTYKQRLTELLSKVEIPIIVKEVGAGMNRETIGELVDIGVKVIDISGHGGSNFVTIENRRRGVQYNLENIGYTTARSLEESIPYQGEVEIIASGGIRSSQDVFKALSMGAKMVGVSKYFLDYLLEHGKDALDLEIKKWQEELKMLMVISNSGNLEEMKGKIRKIK